MRLSHSPILHLLQDVKSKKFPKKCDEQESEKGNAGKAIKCAVMRGSLGELNRVLHAAMGGSEHSPKKIPIHYHINYQDEIFRHTALHLPDWDGDSHRECVLKLLELEENTKCSFTGHISPAGTFAFFTCSMRRQLS